MTYSVIPGFTIILDGLTPANESTVFTKLPGGKIQMDLQSRSNKGGVRGVGVRMGSDIEQSVSIRKEQAQALLKFLYREVNTIGELTQLGTGSVIRYVSPETGNSLTFESWKPDWSEEAHWAQAGMEGSVPTSGMRHFLPAQVIFEAD